MSYTKTDMLSHKIRLALYRKREKPREDRNSRDAENGRVPKQDATVHVHCRCICVTLSFLESQE